MKTLLVLGASSDIGMALLRGVGPRYGAVVAHYNRTADGLCALREELGEKLVLKRADFTSEADTNRFMDEVKADGFRPAHIVHLPSPPCALTRFPKLEWQRVQAGVDVALRSAFLAAKAFLPDMAREKHGKLVVMLTAYTAGRPPKFLADYVTVKYALLGLVQALSREYADKGVRVNGVSPEMTDTRFLDGIPRLAVEQAAQENPLGRNLSPEEVAATIAFLLSEAGDCVSGQNLCVTAGK